MDQSFIEHLSTELDGLRDAGLYKEERVITSPQRAAIQIVDGREVINFCANNYLGLADHPELLAVAREAISKYGYGMASVRFICGTQDVHKTLEARLSAFLGTEDTILYSSCFDANGGLFETLLGPQDAIISDQLNHASIIDGVRLCKGRSTLHGAVTDHATGSARRRRRGRHSQLAIAAMAHGLLQVIVHSLHKRILRADALSRSEVLCSDEVTPLGRVLDHSQRPRAQRRAR